ncbi:MAG: hypothetical protein ACFFDK_12515 [Promethearchaeota archaeon]
MSREEILSILKELLLNFTKIHRDVQGQILIAYPAGVPIVNTWKGEINPILVGALSAAVKLTFRKLCTNLRKGALNRLYMNSQFGRSIIQNAGDKAILTSIIDSEADLGRITFSMSNLAIEIEKILKNFQIEGLSDI